MRCRRDRGGLVRSGACPLGVTGLNSALVCRGNGQTLTPASGRQPLPRTPAFRKTPISDQWHHFRCPAGRPELPAPDSFRPPSMRPTCAPV